MTAAPGPAVVIAGGGTGGHLYPGLAVAEALAARGRRVEFVGTANGIEARVVPGAGFPIHLLSGRQVRGGGVARAVLGVASLFRGVRRALAVLAAVRPGLVVGVGGYASASAVVAARLRRIPTLLLEQNVIPGAANRLLGRLGPRICVGFEDAIRRFAPGQAVYTGNPIRTRVIESPRMRRERLGLLVMGGSGGAHQVNAMTVKAAGHIVEILRGVDVFHQTGPADAAAMRVEWAQLGLAARVEPFIDDMGAAYAAADLVVSRAGAMSCAELTALGLPSILIPYPFAADDHQRANAEVLVRAGAAAMIPDRELTPKRLADAIMALVTDAARRTQMATNARALGRPEAAARVALECERLLDGGTRAENAAPT
jgi:UDP-N-acetylglucosamine--N-acetylmuramyl-(pentapeptide) pyrophosphoryl-undecaprenol N-acetylglucosamine transferase